MTPMIKRLIGSLKVKLILPVIFLALVAQTKSVYALDLDVRSSNSNILDFSLIIEHSKVVFENSPVELTANLQRIGILSIDVPSKGPHFGLILGYAFTDFSNNSSYDTIGMDGYYIGVSARGYLPVHDALSLNFLGHFVYQRVDGKDDQRSVLLSWDEFSATAQLEFSLQGTGYIFAGVIADAIEARYRENGTTDSSIELNNKINQGGIAGFSYEINRLEHVSLSYQEAAKKGVMLRFRKLF